MAELAKKLHFLKNGTEQTAKAYSTTDEVGSIYIPSKIDGVACYIPVGDISDAMATNGRVTKSGTTYAIKSQVKPAYAEQSWTTPGTYTWTCPSIVSRIRVAVCGGGGGSASTRPRPTGTTTANNGGSSEFGSLISATGGNGGYINFSFSNPVTGGAGGSPNGRAGSAGEMSSAVSGGTGFALSFNLTNGSYGNGGASSGSFQPRAGGGSGGYDSSYVNVSPNQSYKVVVGAGGSGNGGDSGKSGFVYIAYGGDI